MTTVGAGVAHIFDWAMRIDLLLGGAGLMGTAIFYLLVEIIHFQPVYAPTLGRVRWLRCCWIARSFCPQARRSSWWPPLPRPPRSSTRCRSRRAGLSSRRCWLPASSFCSGVRSMSCDAP